MEILKSITKSKKSIVNALNSTEGLKDHVGEEIVIDELIKMKKDDDRVVLVLHDKKTDAYLNTISPTILDGIDAIFTSYSEDEIAEGVAIMIMTKKSQKGRDFLYIDLL